MPTATPTPVTVAGLISPVLVALAFIALCSLLREPARKKFSAVFVAGAGAAYFGGGFGPWELAFCAVITALAYRGLAVTVRSASRGCCTAAGTSRTTSTATRSSPSRPPPRSAASFATR